MKIILCLLVTISFSGLPVNNKWEKMVCGKQWKTDAQYILKQVKDKYPGLDDGNGGAVGKMYDDSIKEFNTSPEKQEYYLNQKKAFIKSYDSTIDLMKVVYNNTSFYFNCDSTMLFFLPSYPGNMNDLTCKWCIDPEGKYIFEMRKKKTDTCYIESISDSELIFHYPRIEFRFRLIPSKL